MSKYVKLISTQPTNKPCTQASQDQAEKEHPKTEQKSRWFYTSTVLVQSPHPKNIKVPQTKPDTFISDLNKGEP